MGVALAAALIAVTAAPVRAEREGAVKESPTLVLPSHPVDSVKADSLMVVHLFVVDSAARVIVRDSSGSPLASIESAALFSAELTRLNARAVSRRWRNGYNIATGITPRSLIRGRRDTKDFSGGKTGDR